MDVIGERSLNLGRLARQSNVEAVGGAADGHPSIELPGGFPRAERLFNTAFQHSECQWKLNPSSQSSLLIGFVGGSFWRSLQLELVASLGIQRSRRCQI